MLLQDKAKVLETVAATHDLHLQIPLVLAVQNWLDEMRLSICDVKKYAVVLKDSLNLVVVSRSSS